MAQFDVHRSPGRRREAVPFVVVIQSGWFDHLPTRLVVPLLALTGLNRDRPHLFPEFTIEGRQVVFVASQIQTVRTALLGPVLASLADDSTSNPIINAIDLMISRAHG
jgi:toxin CcdB